MSLEHCSDKTHVNAIVAVHVIFEINDERRVTCNSITSYPIQSDNERHPHLKTQLFPKNLKH